MIELNDITFAYEQSGFTLQAPSLSIGKGEKVAVVGPSGSGKTTLLHLIAGILSPTAGSLTIDGQPISSLPDKIRRKLRLSTMGMVFQSIELIDYLPARENILLPYRLDSALKLDKAARQQAEHLIERVGLQEVADRAVSGLSQGEQQRVGICRALVTGPSLILADEPTASLDEDSASAAMDVLMQLVEESGATLVMLTHDKSQLPMFDRVVSVNRGVVSGGVS